MLHEKLNKVAAGRLARTILNIHFQVDTSLSGSHTGVFPNPKCFLEEGKRTVHFIHDSRSTEIRSTAASLLFFQSVVICGPPVHAIFLFYYLDALAFIYFFQAIKKT